jgi:hypothetical protein
MTDAFWLGATSPDKLRQAICGSEHVRKLRLFACAYFRYYFERARPSDRRELDRAAVELSEAWADGRVEQAEVFTSGLVRRDNIGLFQNEGQLRYTGLEVAFEFGGKPTTSTRNDQQVRMTLLREIFENPFRRTRFDLAWRTDTALAVAQSVYDSRNYGALPILADALQDAGCDAEDLLNHLRDTSATHVRGCWALDLVLGKE